MIWASRWSVALRAFYRQIFSVLYSSFPFGNFRPRLVRALLVYILDYSIYIYMYMYKKQLKNRYICIHTDILFVYEICNDALFSQVRKYKFYFRFYIQLDHFSRRALSQPLSLQNSLGVAYLQFRLSHTLLVSDSIIHWDTLGTFENVRLVVKHLQAMRPFPRLQVRSLKEVCIQRVKHSKRTQWRSAPE